MIENQDEIERFVKNGATFEKNVPFYGGSNPL